jgi:hypothetical protein
MPPQAMPMLPVSYAGPAYWEMWHTHTHIYIYIYTLADPMIFIWSKKAKENTKLSVWLQDGATCYTSRETIPLLRDKFSDRLISLRGQS